MQAKHTLRQNQINLKELGLFLPSRLTALPPEAADPLALSQASLSPCFLSVAHGPEPDLILVPFLVRTQ